MHIGHFVQCKVIYRVQCYQFPDKIMFVLTLLVFILKFPIFFVAGRKVVLQLTQDEIKVAEMV